MKISLIVAASTNNVIGKDKQLPWHLPADMKFFKNTTWAMPVIMGRKTFESLGKPLQGRTNIVITTNKEWKADGVIAASGLQDAMIKADALQTNEVFIIGGGQLYTIAFADASRIYMTRVHTIADGDTFFPEIDQHQWKLVSKHDCHKDEKNPFDYSFEVWERS